MYHLSYLDIKHAQVTKVRNFPKFSSFGDLLWRISEKFLENKFLWLIYWKFSRNSPWISQEYADNISRYSGGTLKQLSRIVPRKFTGIGSEKKFLINFQEFLKIWSTFSPELVRKTSSDRVMRKSLEWVTRNSLERVMRNSLKWVTRNSSDWVTRTSSELVLIYSRERFTRKSPDLVKNVLLHGLHPRNFTIAIFPWKFSRKYPIWTFSADFSD